MDAQSAFGGGSGGGGGGSGEAAADVDALAAGGAPRRAPRKTSLSLAPLDKTKGNITVRERRALPSLCRRAFLSLFFFSPLPSHTHLKVHPCNPGRAHHHRRGCPLISVARRCPLTPQRIYVKPSICARHLI